MSQKLKKSLKIEADLSMVSPKGKIHIVTNSAELVINLSNVYLLKQIPLQKRDLFFTVKDNLKLIRNPILIVVGDKQWLRISEGSIQIKDWLITLKYLFL